MFQDLLALTFEEDSLVADKIDDDTLLNIVDSMFEKEKEDITEESESTRENLWKKYSSQWRNLVQFWADPPVTLTTKHLFHPFLVIVMKLTDEKRFGTRKNKAIDVHWNGLA